MTRELAIAVFNRDRGCIAARLFPAEAANCRGRLTIDHVRDKPDIGSPIVKRGANRKHRYRAPSDLAHCVSCCEGHHVWDGWATAHRAELRDYLRRVNVQEVT